MNIDKSLSVPATKKVLAALRLELEKPDKPTDLYRHYDENNNLLYVGISLSTVKRLGQHRCVSGWYHDIRTVKIEKYPSYKEAHDAEIEAIWWENPKYNVDHNQHNFTGIDRRKVLICMMANNWKVRPTTVMKHCLILYTRYLQMHKNGDKLNITSYVTGWMWGWLVKLCDMDGNPYNSYESSIELYNEMMQIEKLANEAHT